MQQYTFLFTFADKKFKKVIDAESHKQAKAKFSTWIQTSLHIDKVLPEKEKKESDVFTDFFGKEEGMNDMFKSIFGDKWGK